MRSILTACVVVSCSALMVAQSTEKAVREAEARFLAAVEKGDKAGVSALLHDEFTWTNNQRGVQPKDRLIAQISPNRGSKDSDVKAHMFGQVAVVTGIHTGQNHNEAAFAHVWVDQGGAWKLLVHQATDVVAKPTAEPAPAAAAQTGEGGEPAAPAGASAAEKEVIAALTAVEHGDARHDADLFAEYTTDDFVGVGLNDGKPVTKAQRVSALRGQPKQPSAAVGKLTDLHVRVFGDAAVVTADQASPDGTVHFVRVFVKRTGLWQQAFDQPTLLPKDGATTQS